MRTAELFACLRPALAKQVPGALAGSVGVSENFSVELAPFLDALEWAAITGDPSRLDAVIDRWARAQTESDVEPDEVGTGAVFARLAEVTLAAARGRMGEAEAIELFATLLPLYMHCVQQASNHDHARRMARLTDELQAANGKLERLDRTKSNFISVAGHELKTPLTLIEGYATMLGDVLPEQTEQPLTLLNGIHTGVRRLRGIVDDMLDLSLIDTDLLAVRVQPLRLNQIFETLKRELAKAVLQRSLTLEVCPSAAAETMIFADAERLHQALHNVVTNAIKYTPDGGHISIDGRLLPSFIEVTVADTGIGISRQDQATIFEKFEQLGQVSLHSSGKTTFKGGGPGLGLAIARGIIQAHGGAIWVESDGHDEVKCPGTTFHILIPQRSQAADPRLVELFGQEATLTIQ